MARDINTTDTSLERDYEVWADLFPPPPPTKAEIAERRKRERALRRRLRREETEFVIEAIDADGAIIDSETEFFPTLKKAIAAAKKMIADVPHLHDDAVLIIIERQIPSEGEYSTVWHSHIPGRTATPAAEHWLTMTN